MMIIIFLLCVVPLTIGENKCCLIKSVLSGPLEGIYNLKEERQENEDCMDDCVYKRDVDGEDYCFSSVPTFPVECVDKEVGTSCKASSKNMCLISDWWNSCVNTGSSCQGTYKWNKTNFTGYCCEASNIDHNCCVPRKEDCNVKNETSPESGQTNSSSNLLGPLPIMSCAECFEICDSGAAEVKRLICDRIPKWITVLREACYWLVDHFSTCLCKTSVCIPGSLLPPWPIGPVFSPPCPNLD